ncbi:MAG: hypothetical protein QOF76_5634, partial [Solirubrobacteraceae bacterium]|nr:hypothetical protein [Solirubrobacteraceae bacterium]
MVDVNTAFGLDLPSVDPVSVSGAQHQFEVLRDAA